MENRKHVGLMILVSVIVTLLAGCTLVFFFRKDIQPEETVVPTLVQQSDLQEAVRNALSSVSESIVTISISKNLKFYVDDPSQLTAPGNIQSQETKIGGASGILIRKDGYILTNKHVVEDDEAKYEVILNDGRTYQVEHIRLDPAFDLAVIKVTNETGSLPVATFASFDEQAEVGQFVLSIGNMLDLYPNSVGFGIIAGKNRMLKINDKHTYVGLYQTDAKVMLGNSGGPLLNLQGQVIGVTTAVADAQDIAFALPVSAEFITTLLASLETYQDIVRPLIGIEYLDITPAVREEKKLSVDEGILITDVLTGLPASEAGLQKGDIIIAINERPITPSYPFLYHLYTYLPGSTISFNVIRDGDVQKIPVVLGQNVE